jgi:hypothetical protein
MRLVCAALAAWMALSTPAGAADGSLRRFALVVGSNDGGPDRVQLRYADTDALAMAEVLRELGGVDPADLVRLVDPTAAELDAALVALASRVGAAGGTRVEVVVYYSGHSDGLGLLPEGQLYTYERLRARVAAVRADVRVSILDSCASGALIRTKGGTRRPGFLVDRNHLVRGEAYLTSSTADEASQESDSIAASFFTHHLVTGLRGAADADQDGLITLNEAYSYTFRETRRSTASTHVGPQHPNYALDLAGQGDFVMTDLRQTDTWVILEPDLVGLIWVSDPAGRPLAEVDKLADTEVRIALPAGRYTVTLHARPEPRAREVTVEAGRPVRLAVGDLAPYGGLVATRVRGDEAVIAPELPPFEPVSPPVVATAEPASPAPAARELKLSLQAVPGPASRGIAVDGAAFSALYGRHHSLRGFSGALIGHTSLGSVHGAQTSGFVNVARGEVRGFQGSGLVNVARGRLGGAQLAGLVNVAGGLGTSDHAAQISGLANVSSGHRSGVQLTGGLNVASGGIDGVQLSMGGNVAGSRVRGTQLSMGFNQVSGRLHGVQLTSLYNGARELHGAQLASVNYTNHGVGAQVGMVNVASELRGVQLGLINIAGDLDGEAIGLLSIVRNGYHAFELWSDDIAPVSLGFKIGGRHVYSALIIGYDPMEEGRFSLGGGLGVRLQKGVVTGDIDVIARSGELGFDGAYTGGVFGSLRASLGFALHRHVELFLGPALHIGTPVEDPVSFLPGLETPNLSAWVGYQAGLRLPF